MHKVLVLYPHPQSPEHFRQYYVEKHLPLAAQLPGLRASRHSFSIDSGAGPSPYFCIWEGEYDSAEAMQQAMQSSIGQQVVADVANYATGGVVVLSYRPVETHSQAVK